MNHFYGPHANWRARARAILRDLQTDFPSPQAAPTVPAPHDDAYCVGGAVCRTAGYQTSFPTEAVLGAGLGVLNHELARDTALGFAGEILQANDTGDFAGAWAVVAQALAYTACQQCCL